VNLIFVAEGDEERMDIGLRKFIGEHSDLFAEAGRALRRRAVGGLRLRRVDDSGQELGPRSGAVRCARRHEADGRQSGVAPLQMLASLTSKDGNTPLIKGFFENMDPPTSAEVEQLKAQAARTDLKTMARNAGIARFMSDDPFQVLKDGRFGVSFNLDGGWGGNMYAGGAGAILPNKFTTKHNFRYVPRNERRGSRQEAARPARRQRLTRTSRSN